MKRYWPIYVLALAMGVAACGGGSGLTPAPAQNVADSSGGFARYRSIHRAHLGEGKASFALRIPMKKSAHGMRPRFISAYTQSVAISVDGKSPAIFNIGLGTGDCHLVPHAFYIACGIVMSVGGGAHVFSVKTYDRTNATGNLLSANDGVPFTVKPGTTQKLVMTLGGIAKKLVALGDPPAVPSTNGTGTEADLIGTNFNVYNANDYFGMSILAVDADGYLILGPGSPNTKISNPSAPLQVISTPSAQFQNIWVFNSTYSSNNPLTTTTVSIQAQATPVPNSGGSAVSATIKFKLYNHWSYVTNFSSSTVGIFDFFGHAVTPTYESPFSHVPNPSGIAYDDHNTWPYIPDFYDNVICVYTVEGQLVTPSGSFPHLASPSDIAYVNANGKHRLYVTNAVSSPSPVTAFDENGNAVGIAGAWNGLSNPRGIAYDSNNGNLYITDNTQNTVFEYDTAGHKIASFASTLPDTTYGGIAFEPRSNVLFAVDASNNTVIEFDENGNLIATSYAFSGLDSASGIGYDLYNGYLWVANTSDNTVHLFETDGYPVYSFASGGSGPYGFAFVP